MCFAFILLKNSWIFSGMNLEKPGTYTRFFKLPRGMDMDNTWFPLTAAQKMIYRMTQEYPEPEVSCIGACMAFRADLDFGLLKKCIQAEYERYDCLRLRFTAPDGNGEVMQYIAPHEETDIPFFDLRGMGRTAVQECMRGWTAIPFCRADAPMCEFRLVVFEDGEDGEGRKDEKDREHNGDNGHGIYRGVYLRIDHLLADSCAVIALANDVMELYCHEAFGTPKPGTRYSFRAAALKEIERAKDPVRAAAGEAFWKRLRELGEPIYTDIKGPGRLSESRKRHKNPLLKAADRQMRDCREGQASFYLKPEPAGRLLGFCSEHGISMTNLLLMGLRTYLSKQNGGETDISLRNYVSRRSSRLARLSGGSRVHCYPCRTVMGPEIEFLDGIGMIQNLQNNIYRHVDYDSEKVIQDILDYYHAPENTIYESVALTYQPMPVSMQNEMLKGIPCRTMWFSNGVAVQPVYLTVMQNPADLGLEFYVKYQAADYGSDDIERFYDGLQRILFMGVEKPEMAVGEMM